MLTNLEKDCLKKYRAGAPAQGKPNRLTNDDWVRFGLRLLLDAGRMVRSRCPKAGGGDISFKGDGSPVTRLEHDIEQMLRERIATYAPDTVVVGEETGGSLPEVGFAVAIDPVDGTWAFLNATETYATTIAFFQDGKPFLGMVSNPATGEIAYAVHQDQARLIQLSLYGESDGVCTLPLPNPASGGILINFHPCRLGGPVVSTLYDAWARNEIRMVRSPGGSPAWALVEAARGDFVYVNLWSERPSEAYDLVPGGLLVLAAGGSIVNLAGQPIDLIRHRGPFIASTDETALQKVASIIREPASRPQEPG